MPGFRQPRLRFTTMVDTSLSVTTPQLIYAKVICLDGFTGRDGWVGGWVGEGGGRGVLQ